VPTPQLTQAPLPSQNPPEHTVLSASGLVVSTQVGTPVEHEVVPEKQGCGLVLQGWLAVHALHTPLPSHTLLVPQVVPAPTLPLPSTQVADAPVQSVEPLRHWVGLPVQSAPWEHGPQVPTLQVSPASQTVPLGTLAIPSTHVGPPLAHDVVPCLHR
jgi:hypothetical protein